MTVTDVGRVATASTAPPVESVEFRHGVLGWLAATCLLAGFEWLLLFSTARDLFTSSGQALLLLPLVIGNLLPSVLVASLVWLGVERAAAFAQARFRRPRLMVAAALGVLSLPYAVWLARYIFSGPQARTYPHLPLLVALAASLLALAFALLTFGSLLRLKTRAHSVLALALLLGGALIALWASATFLPNDYGHLHTYLALWSILLAALAGRELARLVVARRPGRPGLSRALGAGAVLLGLGCPVILARSQEYSWILWSGTGVSRYATQRWAFLAPSSTVAASSLTMTIKPDLEDARSVAWRAQRAQQPAPNIVLFSIDGLRPDHVGAYGYTRHPTTPNFDRFAKRGVLFTRAYSNYPKTRNFNSAVLLGRFMPPFGSHNPPREYQEQAITQLLDRLDYHIFVKSWFERTSESRFDPREYAIDTGVRKAKTNKKLESPMDDVLARVSSHVEEAKTRDQPVFVWMHLLGTHVVEGKFVPDERFAFGTGHVDQYDSAVAGSDLWLEHLERLLTERLDAKRDTIWLLCSDHGVRLDTASRDLSEGVTRVPLVIVAPGLAPRVEPALVDASVDLAATIVDLAGVKPPASYDGISLVPIMKGVPNDVMSSRLIPLALSSTWKGAVFGDLKYLKGKDTSSLFDLSKDPEGKQNVIEQRAEVAAQMAEVANRELARRTKAFKEGRRTRAPAGDDDDDG